MNVRLDNLDSRLERRIKLWLLRRWRDRLPVTVSRLNGRLEFYWKRPRDSAGRFVPRYSGTRVP